MDLFSINYMHWGSSKQWYGVPSRAATLVEMVAAQSLDHQHQECEHFLRHKTTLISPEVLMANGVPVCSLRQDEGEFVITFPRGYHFGFNYGLNCAESTNFALPVRALPSYYSLALCLPITLGARTAAAPPNVDGTHTHTHHAHASRSRARSTQHAHPYRTRSTHHAHASRSIQHAHPYRTRNTYMPL